MMGIAPAAGASSSLQRGGAGGGFGYELVPVPCDCGTPLSLIPCFKAYGNGATCDECRKPSFVIFIFF